MPINHDAIECLSDVADEALFEVATEASSQALFADASAVATHMENHVLHQPIEQAVVHHAFAQLADVVFDTVADVAFKNGARKLSNLQISEIKRNLVQV